MAIGLFRVVYNGIILARFRRNELYEAIHSFQKEIKDLESAQKIKTK